jgi:hypothetical protein
LQDREDDPRIELTEWFEQALGIDGPQLIERHEPGAALKPAPRTPRVGASTGCHGRYNNRAEVIVQFVRRDNHAWSRLFDFTAQRGIEPNEVDLATNDGHLRYGHSHSS